MLFDGQALLQAGPSWPFLECTHCITSVEWLLAWAWFSPKTTLHCLHLIAHGFLFNSICSPCGSQKYLILKLGFAVLQMKNATALYMTGQCDGQLPTRKKAQEPTQ